VNDLKILIVGDVSAGKFFHVPKFWIHSRCPNCGKIATIKLSNDSESLSDDARANNAVGYAKIGARVSVHVARKNTRRVSNLIAQEDGWLCY
jgi:hypothetical protein